MRALMCLSLILLGGHALAANSDHDLIEAPNDTDPRPAGTTEASPYIPTSRWIQSLGDDSFEVRRKAQAELLKMDPPPVDEIAAAAFGDDDAEIRRRATEILGLVTDASSGKSRAGVPLSHLLCLALDREIPDENGEVAKRLSDTFTEKLGTARERVSASLAAGGEDGQRDRERIWREVISPAARGLGLEMTLVEFWNGLRAHFVDGQGRRVQLALAGNGRVEVTVRPKESFAVLPLPPRYESLGRTFSNRVEAASVASGSLDGSPRTVETKLAIVSDAGNLTATGATRDDLIRQFTKQMAPRNAESLRRTVGARCRGRTLAGSLMNAWSQPARPKPRRR